MFIPSYGIGTKTSLEQWSWAVNGYSSKSLTWQSPEDSKWMSSTPPHLESLINCTTLCWWDRSVSGSISWRRMRGRVNFGPRDVRTYSLVSLSLWFLGRECPSCFEYFTLMEEIYEHPSISLQIQMLVLSFCFLLAAIHQILGWCLDNFLVLLCLSVNNKDFDVIQLEELVSFRDGSDAAGWWSHFYAVCNGRCPGVYYRWSDCEKHVTRFRGAINKSFMTMEEAERFVIGN